MDSGASHSGLSVSGVTITSDRLHSAQTLASPTQRRRSVVRSLGRVIVRL
jgi:hypothetical protein